MSMATCEPLLSPSSLIRGSRQLYRDLMALRPEGHAFPSGSPTVRALVVHASEIMGVSISDILGKSRSRPKVLARKAIVWVARQATNHSYPMIAQILGGRDHSTIIHSEHSAEDLLTRDRDFAWRCERLWAAGECEPIRSMLLDADATPEPEPALPVVVIPKVRVCEGEYTPRHALPPVMAVVDTNLLLVEEDKPDRYSPASASEALLAALHREHPERFAA